MPRIAHVVVPQCPHHITQRGNRREKVFFSDEDRRSFLSLLKAHADRHGLRIDAYCLMDNHLHLVARPEMEQSMEPRVEAGVPVLCPTCEPQARLGWARVTGAALLLPAG